MKVCFIYYKYPLYPKGSYFLEFVNKFSLNVEEVYLIAANYPKCEFFKPDNLKIFWVPLLKVKFLDELFFMFSVLIKVFFNREIRRADIVDCIGPRGLFAGLFLKKFFKIPLICTIEILNEGRDFFNRFYYKFTKFLLIRFPIDKYICWSNYYWENHLKRWGIKEKKVVIIPAGIDTDKYNPEVDGSEIRKKYNKNKYLTVFAKPLYSVNADSALLLLKSYFLVKNKIDLHILLFVGSGEREKEVKELTNILGIKNNVSFLPMVPYDDIPKYIAAADFILLPFTYKPTTARSLLEAMAIGKPIITTSLGEVSRILRNKRNALIVEPEPHLIADSILELISNNTLSKKMVENSINLIKEYFSISIIIKRRLEIIRSCIGDKNGAVN